MWRFCSGRRSKHGKGVRSDLGFLEAKTTQNRKKVNVPSCSGRRKNFGKAKKGSANGEMQSQVIVAEGEFLYSIKVQRNEI